MADLSVTAANVQWVSGTKETGTAGGTVTAGQVIYKDTDDSSQFKGADSNSATALARVAYGIALNGASDEQPLVVQKDGVINIGATVGIGSIYILSATAGGIALAAPVGTTDLVSGMYTSLIGLGITTARLKLTIVNSGVAVP